jgi:peptide/nickel transport system ATP-binding protein
MKEHQSLPLVELRGASCVFRRPTRPWRRPDAFVAVHPTDLRVHAGEIVALVGESGSGKTSLGHLVAGHLAPATGERHWLGHALATSGGQAALGSRLAVQMVWQDAGDALDPRLSVEDSIALAPVFHGRWTRAEQSTRVRELLEQTGLDPGLAGMRPATLSGGQRARVNIARALALDPDLLIADEPTAALDVSVQAQIAALLLALRARRGLAVLLISHDLALVNLMADRVLVMHGGRVIEQGPCTEVFSSPRHPCTARLLVDAGLHPEGMPPLSQAVAPGGSELTGCPFAPSCPLAEAQCKIAAPVPRSVGEGRATVCRRDPIWP